MIRSRKPVSWLFAKTGTPIHRPRKRNSNGRSSTVACLRMLNFNMNDNFDSLIRCIAIPYSLYSIKLETVHTGGVSNAKAVITKTGPMGEAKPKPSGRRLELDAVRGVMLVWITLTHLPTAASTYVNQPFGIVSAAEGFIFLSALFTGRIYFRMAEYDGYRATIFKLWNRSLRLYGYHSLLLAFAFLVAVPIASRGNRPGLHNLLDFYFMAGATRAVIEAALLIYRPPPLDILPMYIIFLMLTSAALLLARRIGWKPVLGVSFFFWGLAQFGFRGAEHTFMMRFIPTRIPLNEMGSFDLWAWQLLWIAGVWLGVRWAQNDLPIAFWAKRWVIPAVMIAAAFFVLRRAIAHGFELGASEFLFDKWHLGPLRLLDFAAVATLLVVWQSALKPLAIRPLVLMGQSSL